MLSFCINNREEVNDVQDVFNKLLAVFTLTV